MHTDPEFFLLILEALSLSSHHLKADLSSLYQVSYQRNYQGFPSGSVGKESACNAEDPSLIPGSGRSPGEGNGNPLQYSCLENSMDRGAGQAAVHGIPKSQT